MTDRTFAEEIEYHAHGADKITACIIGEMGWQGYGEEGKEIPANKKGVVLSWEEARPYLSYRYDSGFGAPKCHAVWVYTDETIIFVSQYDGATSLHAIFRNPVDTMPEMPGG